MTPDPRRQSRTRDVQPDSLVLDQPFDTGSLYALRAGYRDINSAIEGIEHPTLVVGLIAGNFAFRRLPGRPAEWLLCGAVFGATVAVWGLAGAMIASGRRIHRAVVFPLAVLIVGWPPSTM